MIRRKLFRGNKQTPGENINERISNQTIALKKRIYYRNKNAKTNYLPSAIEEDWIPALESIPQILMIQFHL